MQADVSLGFSCCVPHLRNRSTSDAMAEADQDHLDLFLFTTDPTFARRAEQAGVDGVVIDWESKDKATRQQGYDTDTGGDSLADLEAVAASINSMQLLVRVDADPILMPEHVETALAHGATALMLPVAEKVDDVARFLDAVAGRARTIVQIETQALVTRCRDLAKLDWDTAYIGLNDLMISRGSRWIWQPFIDGTVQRIYDELHGRRIGFGGVTAIGSGKPLPFSSLLSEMARLGCSMSFLRRTFNREIVGRDMPSEIEAIRALWRAQRRRTLPAIHRDRERFEHWIHRTQPPAAASG